MTGRLFQAVNTRLAKLNLQANLNVNLNLHRREQTA